MTVRAITRRENDAPSIFDRDPFFTPFFDRFLSFEPFRSSLAAQGEDFAGRNWVPAVDVKESEEAFVLHAELPGLGKDDVHVLLEDGVLRLSGERKFEKEDKKDNFHRIERAYGKFSRSFTLGSGVDASKVSASFKDGVLTVTVPKAAETKPRRIEIQ